MRAPVTITAFTAYLASASALTVRQGDGVPSCAIACLSNTEAPLGSCVNSDFSCLCKNAAFVQFATNCVQTTCSGSDLTAAEAASIAICQAVGVDISGSYTAAPSSSTARSSSTIGSSSAADGASVSTASSTPGGASSTPAASSTAGGASVGGAASSTTAAPSPSTTKSAGFTISIGCNIAVLGGLAAALCLLL